MAEGKGVALAILGIVAVIAVVGLVLLFSGASGKGVYGGQVHEIVYPATWSPCTEGETQCVGYSGGAHFISCTRGRWKLMQYCSANTQCDDNQGCVPR